MGLTQEHAATVHYLAFLPNGTWIASGSWEMTKADSDKRGVPTLIHIWDTATGNQISNLDMGSSVFSIAISPSGMQIAVGCWDSTVYLYSYMAMHLVLADEQVIDWGTRERCRSGLGVFR